ncbi:hypothetical protein ABZ635_22130 [Nocardiopsis sp. NPDC007018]|uniref:hypothetical protein n=1 Tax=Nocardiopsis sp. NPDC007018 TaxID=3155721 RepID=UPI003404BC8B
MQTYPGRDPLGEYFREEITLRQLRVMVEHLPQDSALHRAVRGHGWQESEYLLAEVADAVRTLAAITVAVNSKRPKSVKMPEPLPRPIDEADEARKAEERAYAEQAYSDLVSALTPDYADT